MTTFPTDFSLSETPDENGRLDPASIAYIGALTRHLAHELVLGAYHRSGLSKGELARRLDWDPSRVGRLINVPGNITVETLGELLFAIDGSAPCFSQSWPCREKRSNYSGPDWLVVEPSTQTSDPRKATQTATGVSSGAEYVLTATP